MGAKLDIILRLRDEVTKRITTIQGRMVRMGNVIKANWKGMAFAATGAAFAIGMMVKKSVDYGVKLDEMSKQAQITTEEFSRLAYAAEQEHASIETLTKIFPSPTK